MSADHFNFTIVLNYYQFLNEFKLILDDKKKKYIQRK